jgi:hypothetical protein
MAYFCCRSCFPQNTKPADSSTTYFHRSASASQNAQIHIKRFVSDAHRAPTQLDRIAILIQHHFIVRKLADDRQKLCPRNHCSRRRLKRVRRGRFLTERSKKDANRTDPSVAGDRELRAAGRASTFAAVLTHPFCSVASRDLRGPRSRRDPSFCRYQSFAQLVQLCVHVR